MIWNLKLLLCFEELFHEMNSQISIFFYTEFVQQSFQLKKKLAKLNMVHQYNSESKKMIVCGPW